MQQCTIRSFALNSIDNSDFGMLPDELICKIFGFLSLDSALCMSKVCIRFHDLVTPKILQEMCDLAEALYFEKRYSQAILLYKLAATRKSAQALFAIGYSSFVSLLMHLL